jgi:hypothetical protein
MMELIGAFRDYANAPEGGKQVKITRKWGRSAVVSTLPLDAVDIRRAVFCITTSLYVRSWLLQFAVIHGAPVRIGTLLRTTAVTEKLPTNYVDVWLPKHKQGRRTRTSGRLYT